MTLNQAIVSGALQGITEFFPISSNGHLVILHNLFNIEEPQLAFDIFLHLGTLLSIFLFFWTDIVGLAKRENRPMLLFIVVGSIPTAIIGISFKDAVEKTFAMPMVAGYMLMITGLWLILASVIGRRNNSDGKGLTVSKSVAIGIAQGAAIMPGLSRSGLTIGTGMMAGLERQVAFKFSFLLAIPAITGAGILKVKDIYRAILGKETLAFVIGAFTAAIVGLVVIRALLGVVKANRLYIFGIYCIVISSLVISGVLRR